jgi:hypothetical protein
MKMPSFHIALLCYLCMAQTACVKTKHPEQASLARKSTVFVPGKVSAATFNDYWYQGKAELNTYEVEQERYGEMRAAEEMMLFVTEDLSASKQVKLDDAAAAGADRVPVLKMNAVRRFHTGIYDYSIMQSVFVPTDGSAALKSTATVQDWCGHVFSQMNLEKDAYRFRLFSYFESEGDQDKPLPKVWLEDELFTRLRLGPDKIPQGTVRMLPSAVYARLRHRPMQEETASLSIRVQDKESTLEVQYQNIDRRLSIQYETAFPHRILGWEEITDQKTSSKGALKASRMSAYWSEHDNRHAPLRDSLLLRF